MTKKTGTTLLVLAICLATGAVHVGAQEESITSRRAESYGGSIEDVYRTSLNDHPDEDEWDEWDLETTIWDDFNPEYKDDDAASPDYYYKSGDYAPPSGDYDSGYDYYHPIAPPPHYPFPIPPYPPMCMPVFVSNDDDCDCQCSCCGLNPIMPPPPRPAPQPAPRSPSRSKAMMMSGSSRRLRTQKGGDNVAHQHGGVERKLPYFGGGGGGHYGGPSCHCSCDCPSPPPPPRSKAMMMSYPYY
jgi:hypothetical protein